MDRKFRWVDFYVITFQGRPSDCWISILVLSVVARATPSLAAPSSTSAPSPTLKFLHLLLRPQLFCDVHLRGGYEFVVMKQQWGDMCVSQGVHPQMAASAAQPNLPAAAAMRTHYERCLLDFEEYVTNGQFEQDVAMHRLVPYDRIVDVPGATPAKRKLGAERGAKSSALLPLYCVTRDPTASMEPKIWSQGRDNTFVRRS